MKPLETVFVIDDDPSVRGGLSRLLRSSGCAVEAFASAREFLGQVRGTRRAPGSACIVLDVRMPGMSGVDLQEELARIPGSPPIVFVTGHGDIPTGVRAMKTGAVDFLTKPFDREELLAAVRAAIGRDRDARRRRDEAAEALERIRSLTPREREVLSRVVAGSLNKQIAADLGVSEATVKVHRGRVMRKMGVRSVADLVREFERGITGPERTTKV